MTEQITTIDDYRQAKESGIDLYEVQEDAAPEEEQQIEKPQEDQETEPEQETEQDDEQELDEEEIEVPEEQKTAFQKALEREKRKAREHALKKVREELEAEYNPYKAFFDRLGLDPQKALEAIEQSRIRQEAQRLADERGWTDVEMQMYIRQQELEREQTEMRVSLRIYELADTPDYPGIKQMKNAITEFIRANPRATVEQAYWAVGGQSLAQQLKREAEQRAVKKREQSSRKVVSDTISSPGGPAPLPPEAVAFMKETGMSEEEVRLLISDKMPSNIEEYRKWKRRS